MPSAMKLLGGIEAVDIFYFDFSKVFSTVSLNIFTGKFRKCGLNEFTVRMTENWPNQGVAVSGTGCSWRPVTSGVSQGSKLCPVFNSLINGLDGGPDVSSISSLMTQSREEWPISQKAGQPF